MIQRRLSLVDKCVIRVSVKVAAAFARRMLQGCQQVESLTKVYHTDIVSSEQIISRTSKVSAAPGGASRVSPVGRNSNCRHMIGGATLIIVCTIYDVSFKQNDDHRS